MQRLFRVGIFSFLFFLALYTLAPTLRRADSLLRVSTMCLLALACWAIQRDLAKRHLWAERRFWSFLGAAMAVWLTADLLLVLEALIAWDGRFQLTAEIGFAAYYAAMILAIEQQPHRRKEFDLVRRVDLPAVSLLLLSLFTYFILLPTFLGTWSEEGYGSAAFYALIDVYLAFRVTRLYFQAQSPHWRTIYAVLIAYSCCMIAGDFAYAESDDFANFFYSLAALAMIHAATRKCHPLADQPTNAENVTQALPRIGGALDPSWPTLIFALTFPAVHVLLYRASQLSEATRAIREDLVILWTLILGLVAVVQNRLLQDLTTKLEKRRRLLEFREHDLKTKSAEFEQLTYAISHDLKSPLFTIERSLDLLRTDLDSSDPACQARTILPRIQGVVARMNETLEGLLEISSLGHKNLHKEAIPLQRLIEEVSEMLSGGISERGIELTTSEDLPIVHADPALMRRALQNLLENSIKFMGSQPHPRIEIGLQHPTGAIRIRDNGQGIAPADQERIFGLFQRGETSVPGSGLGLAMVQRIVEKHEGRIWVESEGRNRGTTFWLELPVAHTAPRSGEV